MSNSGILREELMLNSGLSDAELVGHLSLLGIEDKDIFSEEEAGVILSAAAGAASVTKDKPKKASGKGGKMTRSQVSSAGGAIDAGSVGQAFASQIATSQQAGEKLADENLGALAGAYKNRMAAGLAMFAEKSTDFLQRAIALDGEAEAVESRPLDQVMGEIFNL